AQGRNSTNDPIHGQEAVRDTGKDTPPAEAQGTVLVQQEKQPTNEATTNEVRELRSRKKISRPCVEAQTGEAVGSEKIQSPRKSRRKKERGNKVEDQKGKAV
ncbi:ubiquitin-conjugating enzyme/RWD-like protein, partial [Sesbania bispinosa]